MKSFRNTSQLVGVLLIMGLPVTFAQVRWTVPRLRELNWKTDQIGSNRAKFSRSEVRVLKEATAHAIGACLSDPGPGDPHTARELFAQMRAARVELGPKQGGVLVQGNAVCMCGATGNCEFWLFADETAGLKLVLHTTGIEAFELSRSLSRGHFDLILGSHDSASEKFLQKYRFDGVGYRPVGCALLDYVDYNTMKALKVPRLSPVACGG